MSALGFWAAWSLVLVLVLAWGVQMLKVEDEGQDLVGPVTDHPKRLTRILVGAVWLSGLIVLVVAAAVRD